MSDDAKKAKELKADFFSGLVSGLVAVTICSPLDLARVRYHVMVSN
jgi:hypothetical protein